MKNKPLCSVVSQQKADRITQGIISLAEWLEEPFITDFTVKL